MGKILCKTQNQQKAADLTKKSEDYQKICLEFQILKSFIFL